MTSSSGGLNRKLAQFLEVEPEDLDARAAGVLGRHPTSLTVASHAGLLSLALEWVALVTLSGPPGAARATTPVPALPMPAHYRIRRDDPQVLAPAGTEPTSQDPHQLVCGFVTSAPRPVQPHRDLPCRCRLHSFDW